MEVVCSFVGGAGHLLPQLPLHRALVEAGGSLSLVGRSSATGLAPGWLYGRILRSDDRRNSVTETISPIAPLDVEHELAVVTDYFAGAAARKSASQVEEHLVGADLLVCDELDFGAIAAAQRRGIPTVVVAVIASGALVRPERLVGPLRELARDLGCREPIRPRGDFFVVPFAPAMRDPEFPPPDDTLWMRPDEGLALVSEPDGAIVATLGTEFNTESGDLFDRMLRAAADIGAPSTFAIGQDLDPARFGFQPPTIALEGHSDLDALIPRASVVLHHGGSGLFVRSVLGGAPQLVFPMGADQPFTAQQVERLGIGRTLDAQTASHTAIAEAIAESRSDGVVRERVLRLRESLLSLPPAADVVARLLA